MRVTAWAIGHHALGTGEEHAIEHGALELDGGVVLGDVVDDLAGDIDNCFAAVGEGVGTGEDLAEGGEAGVGEGLGEEVVADGGDTDFLVSEPA